MTLTPAERDYLQSHPFGRLATVSPDGTVQNNPVGFRYNAELGTIDIGGWNMGTSRKFRNIERGSTRVAFVVDDIVSDRPGDVRGVEIRGDAQALHDQRPYLEGLSPELIRIRPRTVFSWAVEPNANGMRKRVI